MDAQMILKYAMKGITDEIESLEKVIKEGYKYIEQIENGEIPKIKKSKYEILEILKEKEAEMKKLEHDKFLIKWELEVEMKKEPTT